MDLRSRARPGDLIFYRVTPHSTFTARLIAILQLLRGEGESTTQYSHVAILDRDTDFCIEAMWPRVRMSKVNWEDPELELWRRPMGSAKISLMLIDARGRVGDWYDAWGLLFGALGSRHRSICTTLILKSFASIGVDIGAEAGKILTPNELVADPAMRFVGMASHGRK